METSTLRKIGKALFVTAAVALTLWILFAIAFIIALSQDGVQLG